MESNTEKWHLKIFKVLTSNPSWKCSGTTIDNERKFNKILNILFTEITWPSLAKLLPVLDLDYSNNGDFLTLCGTSCHNWFAL